MEHIIKLNEYAAKLRDYANQVQNAKDTTTLDQAKLAGLQIYQETLREANRAFQEFNALAREARAHVNQINFEATKKAAKAPTIALADEETAPITAKIEKAVKKVAKRTKKAKK